MRKFGDSYQKLFVEHEFVINNTHDLPSFRKIYTAFNLIIKTI